MGGFGFMELLGGLKVAERKITEEKKDITLFFTGPKKLIPTGEYSDNSSVVAKQLQRKEERA